MEARRASVNTVYIGGIGSEPEQIPKIGVDKQVFLQRWLDASGWWMLAAAAVAAHVGIQEDMCAIHVDNCVYLRSR